MLTFCPIISASAKPNTRSAAGLTLEMMPLSSMMMMAPTAVCIAACSICEPSSRSAGDLSGTLIGSSLAFRLG